MSAYTYDMSSLKQTRSPPEVLLLLGTHCPHCPAVVSSLAELVKKGVISSVEMVNLEAKPEVAERLGVRTVPWLRIGWYELEGLRSKAELEQWVARVGSDAGMAAYFSEILAVGKVKLALRLLEQHADAMAAIFILLSDADEKINVRLGVGVIIEEHATRASFKPYIPVLGELTQHEDERVRSDAGHYLALTGDKGSVQYIRPLLDDASDDVREVARESMELLNEAR